ncbi:MAG: hypothetical protein U9N54_08240 [candidate division Zixibacteria bacterium]|nr:hypothetical protein [candidate division Zixibacteria bacterium]
MLRLFSILVLVLLFAVGCSDDPVSSEDTEATFYYRTVGTGTVKLEFYTIAQNDTYYRNLLYELTRVDIANNIVANDEIIPLADGNKWVYNIKVFDSTNVQIYSGVDSSWVARDTTLDNQLWHILADKDGPFQIATNRDDGYYARDVTLASGTTDIDSVGEAYLSAKYPVNVGETFPNKTGFITEVLSTDDSVTVPAGSFSCYKYKRTEQ